jgi:ParB family chromosome partitioning protein
VLDARMIPVDKIREPEDPDRTLFDEDAADELARSVRDHGIIEPLVVRPLEDGTFEVIAGHRRLLAARCVGLMEAPCVVREGDAPFHAVRLAENLDREDLSPVDEGRRYKRLFESNGEDVDRVCAIVKRPRARVEGRILLLAGDPRVLDALERGEIGVGVAEELNAFKRSEGRSFHLDFAIRTGATRAQVREWRTRDDAVAAGEAAAADAAAARGAGLPSDPTPPPRETPYAAMAKPYAFSSSLEPRECVFCKGTDQEWRMFRVFVCAEDAQKYLAPLEKGGGG